MKTDVGNLATVMSRWTFSGIWFSRDHRFDLEGSAHTISVIVACVVFAFAIVGLWRASSATRGAADPEHREPRRDEAHLDPVRRWMDLKALCLAAPVSLLMAVVGLSWGLRASARC